MKKTKAIQLTKPWQKIVCVLGIPLLANTIASLYFPNKTSITIALLITALFVYDVVKRRRGKTIWDLDDAWERAVYKISWASLIISVVLITLTFLVGAMKP